MIDKTKLLLLIKIYKKSDIFVMPSLAESFGQVSLQSNLAAGSTEISADE